MVDIQPDTVAARNVGDLIETANSIIAEYDPSRVIYIANLRPFASPPKSNVFAEGLAVVSDKVFFKKRPDAFSNQKLAEALGFLGASEVEIIGIDGNWCIKGTALGAVKRGLKATVNTRAVVSSDPAAFENKTKRKLAKSGVCLV